MPNGVVGTLVLLLQALVGSVASRAPMAEPATPESAWAGARAEVRCPMTLWRGKCRRMTGDERDRISAVAHAYAATHAAGCADARNALVKWLEGTGEAWLFEHHSLDDRAVGKYVLAETAHVAATRVPAGLGFRTAVLQAEPVVIARVALHEGAHLAGAEEEPARQVEETCLLR